MISYECEDTITKERIIFVGVVDVSIDEGLFSSSALIIKDSKFMFMSLQRLMERCRVL